MRRNICFILSIMLLAALAACRGGQKDTTLGDDTPVIEEPTIEINDADRKTVDDSLTVFLNLMRDHQFEKAVGMLWVWDGEFVSRLSDDAARKQLSIYRQLQGIDYELESVKFNTETDNIAKYRVVLFEKEEDDSRPNAVSFGLNPIRREGKWYLTVSDSFAETH